MMMMMGSIGTEIEPMTSLFDRFNSAVSKIEGH